MTRKARCRSFCWSSSTGYYMRLWSQMIVTKQPSGVHEWIVQYIQGLDGLWLSTRKDPRNVDRHSFEYRKLTCTHYWGQFAEWILYYNRYNFSLLLSPWLHYWLKNYSSTVINFILYVRFRRHISRDPIFLSYFLMHFARLFGFYQFPSPESTTFYGEYILNWF